MDVTFPYPHVPPLTIPDTVSTRVLTLPPYQPGIIGAKQVQHALEHPIGSRPLCVLAAGCQRVLIVADDVSRPTPVHQFVELVLDELRQAGISDNHIEFMMALGTHRPMNREEIAQKLGDRVASRYRVHNHQWDNPDCLDYIGETDQGVPVWINTMVRQADLVIGLGSIMPIEVCGFTGGGKILVPGVSGQVTVDQMHWTRIDVPSQYILGRVENPIRASIDALARKAGLDFIVNVILDAQNRIIGAVAGDMIAAHRCGCEIARKVYGVPLDREYDIVIADSFPFDNEFWQANKALSTTGEFVKKGGVVILVTPCHEGFSQTHGEILEFGYLPIEQIKQMVNNGAIKHKVVGVHMAQASAVAIEKARLILVSTGIRRQQAKQVGFNWAPTPQDAFNQAVDICDSSAKVAVLKNASRMLPLKSSME